MTEYQERRRFFRINDALRLSLKPVTGAQVAMRLQDTAAYAGAGRLTLVTALDALSQTLVPSLRRIELQDPDVADYLKNLDKKIDLLAHALLAEEMDIADQPACAVNLSAGGMAVCSREAFASGQALEIKLLLLPTYTGILTYGSVVDCTPATDLTYPYRVRIDFSFIRDADRDALIRHVLLKQAETLRARRERRGGDAAASEMD